MNTPYTVFALKWRPRNFDEIVGQNHVVTTLKSAIEKNRLAHAYLFAGPRGVGKTSTARILAKSLNCTGGPTTDPCNKCSSCVEINQGRSLDVIEIDGASNRGIDEIRTLRENVKFPPTSGKYKIYIIDEVHMLTTEAFNALLKTLEEPPEFIKFIFATTNPAKVITTILSRCQRFDFRRIPLLELIAQLKRIAGAEKINTEDDVLFAIAKASDGSLRDAESLLDQLVSFSKDKIDLKDVISVLGIIEQDVLFEIADKIIAKDPLALLGLLNNVIDQGKDPALFLADLIGHFRNLMVAKVTRADVSLIDLPEEFCQRLLKQAESFTLQEIFVAFNSLLNTQEMAKRLDSWRIPLEITMVKLSCDKKTPGLSHGQDTPVNKVTATFNHPVGKEIKEVRMPAPQPLSADTPAEPNEPKPDPQERVPEEDDQLLERVKNSWQDTIDAVGKIKISVGTYLSEGSPQKLHKGMLTICFPQGLSLHKESLERRESKALIEKVLLESLGVKLNLVFILSKDAVKRENTQEHPAVKSALETFKARVIKE